MAPLIVGGFMVFETFALTFALGGIAYSAAVVYACCSILRIEVR